MNEGELYKRCVDRQKSWCTCCGDEPDDEPKFCDTWREPTKEEIKNALDEAKKEFYDLLNSETETNYGERQRFRELVKKWLGELK